MPEQLDAWQKLMVGQGHPVGKLDMKNLVVTPSELGEGRPLPGQETIFECRELD